MKNKKEIPIKGKFYTCEKDHTIGGYDEIIFYKNEYYQVISMNKSDDGITIKGKVSCYSIDDFITPYKEKTKKVETTVTVSLKEFQDTFVSVLKTNIDTLLKNV